MGRIFKWASKALAAGRARLLEDHRGRTRRAGTQAPATLLPHGRLTGGREGFPGLHGVTSPATAATIKTLFKNSPSARWAGLFPPRNYPRAAAQPAQLLIEHGWLQCHIGSEMPPRSRRWCGAVPPCAHIPVPPRGSSAVQAPGDGAGGEQQGLPAKGSSVHPAAAAGAAPSPVFPFRPRFSYSQTPSG